MTKLTDAIKSINPDAKFTVHESGNLDVAEIIWLEGTPEISKADLQVEMDRMNYARARALAYPMTKEFIEAYTEKEILNDDTKWNEYVTKYNKVRTDNPKG